MPPLDHISFLGQILLGVPPNRYSQDQKPSHHQDGILAAARRAKLGIQRFGNYRLFTRGEEVVGAMHGMMPSVTSAVARDISGRKTNGYQALAISGLPVPVGAEFKPAEAERALGYAHDIGWPVVVKPSNLAGGRGVTIAIADDEGFAVAWQTARIAMKEAGGTPGSIIVERFAAGVDLRIIVIGGRFVCAMTRLPANVIGDGASSIVELVDAKNMVRAENPHLRQYPIRLDDAARKWLQSRGLSFETVPAAGQIVLLRGPANLSSGGDSVDTTDLISSPLKALAEAAARSIPGLGFVGVDLVTPSLSDARDAVILELNPTANIGIHYYPVYGERRDPGTAIVKEMLRLAGNARARMSNAKPAAT